MSQTIITPDIITKEALMMLENNLVFAKKVNRGYEDQHNPNKSFKRGDTINVRMPNRFTVSTDAALDIQDITERSVPVIVNVQDHVDFNFATKDLTLEIEEFNERYVKPAMAALANKIDYTLAGLYNEVYNQIGTPRTTPSTFLALANCARRLNEEGAPLDDERYLCIDPAAQAVLADAFKLHTNPSGQISDIFEKGKMVEIAGLKVYMDQNIRLHTSGTVSNTTPAVHAGIVAGNTRINIDGLNGATVTAKKGDTFTIAGVYAVNPQSRQSTGVLKQFVVMENATASSSEFGTIVNTGLLYAPVMYATGPLQNVTALPVDGDLVTFFDPAAAVSTQNIAFHRDAFTLVTVPLEKPQGVHFSARDSYKGLNLRIVRQYRIATDDIPCRIDILYGVKCIYPELAVRLAG